MAGDKALPDSWDVEAAWSSVAAGYRDYWLQRFRPLLERAIQAFEPPGHGPIAIPGCGPGDEVLLLAKKFPGRTLVATDPAAEMLALCRAAIRQAGLTTAIATQGRAENLSSTVRQAAGVFCAFTLQLLPDPARALLDWSRALQLGGVVTTVFWPRPAPESPHGRLFTALQQVAGEERPGWEESALHSLAASGLTLRRDERLHARFEHASPNELYDAIVERGPLRGFLTRRGREVVEAVRRQWLQNPGLEHSGGVWYNPVEARLWCLEKTATPGASMH